MHSGNKVGSLSHDQAHRRIELSSQLGDAERRHGRERGFEMFVRTEPHAQRRGLNEFMTVRVVLAWEFPFGALRWSRKSQMPCERGMCEDRKSHDVRRDMPIPASGVAAVGHKITECSPMGILDRVLTMTTGPPSSTTLTMSSRTLLASSQCSETPQRNLVRELCVSCQLGNLKFDDVLNDLLGKDQAQTQRGNCHAS